MSAILIFNHINSQPRGTAFNHDQLLHICNLRRVRRERQDGTYEIILPPQYYKAVSGASTMLDRAGKPIRSVHGFGYRTILPYEAPMLAQERILKAMRSVLKARNAVDNMTSSNSVVNRNNRDSALHISHLANKSETIIRGLHNLRNGDTFFQQAA